MELNQNQQEELEKVIGIRDEAESESEIEEEESSIATRISGSFKILDLSEFPENIDEWITDLIINNRDGICYIYFKLEKSEISCELFSSCSAISSQTSS